MNVLLVSFCAAAMNLILFLYRREERDAVAATACCCAFVVVLIYKIFIEKPVFPEWPALRQGEKRIVVAGYPISPPTAHAHMLADRITQRFFKQGFTTWYVWDMFHWSTFCVQWTKDKPFPSHLRGHCTSPFVAIVELDKNGDELFTPIGGNDRFCEWVLDQKFDVKEIDEFARQKPSVGLAVWHSHLFPATAGVEKNKKTQ